MLPYFNLEEQKLFYYKKQLNKDANRIGLILLLFFTTMMVFSFGTIIVVLIAQMLNGTAINQLGTDILNDTSFLMLENGLISLITFFGVTIIYSIIVKADFGKTFPVEKTGFKLTYHLCALGLAIALIANYVSNMIIALFSLFNVDAYTDINYECNSLTDIILFYVCVAVLPALIEEFAFRGIVLHTLKKYSEGLAILISAILFGLMHGNFTQIPFAFVVGLILGYIAVKTNSLLPCIIIHFLNNALSVTITLLYSNFALPEYVADIINSFITIAVAVLGIISFAVLCKKHKGFFKLKSGDEVMPFKEKVKIVIKSPTIIIFTIISLAEAILMLTLEV